MSTINPFARPLYVMLKPAGSLCNLRCKYCYYLEKNALYTEQKNHVISDEMLDKFIREYIEAQTSPDVLFCWHGGETLMRPISFYRRAIELQRKYARGRRIDNTIQTNATMLTDEWCEFFRENNFLVGVSIDGPQEFHVVERRIERNDGLSLAPGMEEGGELVDFSVTPEQWGKFLCTIFDEWVRHDVGTYFIQIFDATLANWAGVQPGLCSLAKECGHAGVMEFNGDVYSCDHFVYPEHLLGNINEKTITEMMYGEKQREFAKLKHELLPQQCRECPVEFACHGECPKNRFTRDKYGNPGLNYLCKGYRQFFEHVKPYMDFMKGELDAKRPPSNVMNFVASAE